MVANDTSSDIEKTMACFFIAYVVKFFIVSALL